MIKWIPAKIMRKIGNQAYLINVNSCIRFVHQNQIKKSKLPEKFHPRPVALEDSNCEALPLRAADPDNKSPNPNGKFEVRRSTRKRKQPDRLYISN